MTTGPQRLADAYAKLDWATGRHDQMQIIFAEFARPGGGDERPYGIQLKKRVRPPGLVVATFIVERARPMSLLAADLIRNTRTAVDHVLARLKEAFGRKPAKGSFRSAQPSRRGSAL